MSTASGVMLLSLLTVMALIHARSNRSLSSRLTRRQAGAEFRALTDPLTGSGNGVRSTRL